MTSMRAAIVAGLVVGLAGCSGSTTSSSKPASSAPNTAVMKSTSTKGGSESQSTAETKDKTPAITDSNNADKIVGKWEVTKSETSPPGATLEFTKDGMIHVTMMQDGKETKMDARYTVEGDKVTLIMKDKDGKEHKDPATITKLTDDQMIVKDDKGKVEEYKRVK